MGLWNRAFSTVVHGKPEPTPELPRTSQSSLTALPLSWFSIAVLTDSMRRLYSKCTRIHFRRTPLIRLRRVKSEPRANCEPAASLRFKEFS